MSSKPFEYLFKQECCSVNQNIGGPCPVFWEGLTLTKLFYNRYSLNILFMSRSVDCFNICLIASLHYPACSAADLAALQCNCAHCVSSAYYTIQKPIIMPDFARLMQSVFNITTVCYHKSRNSISLYFLLFYMWKKPTKQNTRCDKYTIWINVTGKSGNLSVRIFQQNIVFKYYQS